MVEFTRQPSYLSGDPDAIGCDIPRLLNRCAHGPNPRNLLLVVDGVSLLPNRFEFCEQLINVYDRVHNFSLESAPVDDLPQAGFGKIRECRLPGRSHVELVGPLLLDSLIALADSLLTRDLVNVLFQPVLFIRHVSVFAALSGQLFGLFTPVLQRPGGVASRPVSGRQK